jgi:cytochrome P450
MVAAASRCAERCADAIGRAQHVDIGSQMLRLVLEITGLTLFGVDCAPYADVVSRSTRAALEEIHERVEYPMIGRYPLPTPARLRRLAASRELDTIAREIVAERRARVRQSGAVPDDLLGHMLAHQADGQLTDEAIVGETRNFLVGSHETSAAVLTWCWLMFATHPDAEATFHDELTGVLGGREPTVDDVGRLGYTRMLIEETMRLYPPAPYFGRVALEDDTIDGYHIPAGSHVVPSAWVTHRHPDFWDEPDSFHPDRFSPSRSAGFIEVGRGEARLTAGRSMACVFMRKALAQSPEF